MVEWENGIKQRRNFGESHNFLQEDLLKAQEGRREDEMMNMAVLVRLVMTPIQHTLYVVLLQHTGLNKSVSLDEKKKE